MIRWFIEFWEYFNSLWTFPNWGSLVSMYVFLCIYVCCVFLLCCGYLKNLIYSSRFFFFRGSWLLNYRWIFKSLCFLCQNRSGLRWANIREVLFTWNFQRCPKGSQLEILKKEGYDIYGERSGDSIRITVRDIVYKWIMSFNRFIRIFICAH